MVVFFFIIDEVKFQNYLVMPKINSKLAKRSTKSKRRTFLLEKIFSKKLLHKIMGKKIDQIQPEIKDFIEKQKLFS